MKLIHLNKIIILLIVFYLSSCCKNEINGTFLVQEIDKKYFPDTTITSFNMIDDNGITDKFHIRNLGNNHRLLSRHSEPNRCGDGYVVEYYNVQYFSEINNFNLGIEIKNDFDGRFLTFEWNFLFYLVYNFDTKIAKLNYPYTTEGETDTTTYYPNIVFLDSLNVFDVVYKDVIEIDLQEIVADNKVPKKVYLASDTGLVQFVLKNGITYKRQ